MAVSNAMFIFEVMVENVRSLVESRHLVIRSDFADIFSLELKDPKTMHIVMPEPLPLPPEPPGKKGKKKKPPKPKKGKKGKKEEEPPPEPSIQSGQSVLFSSNAEFLTQSMRKCPMELSLWSKEDNLVYIGTTMIPWDPIFYIYLEKIFNCQQPEPVTLKEEYNIFEEGTAKMMAKMGLQIKLSYLTDKVTTAFRTLSEDPSIRKCMYTGINSKTTSYMCTLKTTDDEYRENYDKIKSQYVVDKPKPVGKVTYATFKNAPGANLTFFNEGDYCCMKHADKPPESIYKAPECCPDIDFIIDYVRKTIVSCNDNMRMMTPRPTITPRVKATDIDRLCYCKETDWPAGTLVERFKKEVQSGPCPICIEPGQKATGSHGATFDIACIRGPCGKVECRIARSMRAYIENLVDEDNVEFNMEDIIGPCGSKDCTVAERIQQFLRHEGMFTGGEANKEGLSTQCACIETMQHALTKRKSCASLCSKECDESDSETSNCEGKGCPYPLQVYNVYYFTVEHDFEKETSGASNPPSEKSSKHQHCSLDTCPNLKAAEKASCSKSICSSFHQKTDDEGDDKCQMPICPDKKAVFPPSPADSNVELNIDEIHNPCCVKTCDVAEKIKDFIVDGIMGKKDRTKSEEEDSCYCDCVCTFKFSNKTTYCAVCGGYECLGDDMTDQPEFVKPHPCPVYHKLYDKTFIRVQSPWPEEEKQDQIVSGKSSRVATKLGPLTTDRRPSRTRSARTVTDKKSTSDFKEKKQKVAKEDKEKKKVGKFTAVVEEQQSSALVEKKPETKYPYPPVPKHMGWNWNAEDIPGLKFRPKWRPGAANKILVRRYRALREGMDIIGKKKRALMQRKKKAEMKPTLTVSKKDGEFIVQMEVFKKYSKERLLFQYPYEEKPPVVYTVGKTEEEKQKIQRQRERRERRETRRKSRLLQSTFRDKCQEICLKAYNQAIGLLPLPNPNVPECPCHTESAQNSSPPIDSCSCSEEGTISSSDTDNDEWVIEFSPPAALWDSRAKHPPVLADNESQYSYLDYKVKLLDKTGNPIPRYFKGPDGKQECSDLGGFWNQAHQWLEINKEGYIGPDNRWVPMNFIGPDGMFYSAEDGSFTDNNGQLLKIGVDGYIDKDGKWAWYSKGRRRSPSAMTVAGKKSDKSAKSEPAGKGKDTKGKPAAPPAAAAKGKSTEKKPSPILSPKSVKGKGTGNKSQIKGKNPLVMSVSMNYDKYKSPRLSQADNMRWLDPKKIAKYREIMDDLQMYADIGDLKVPAKTNRASNTPRKKVSPFTIFGAFGQARSPHSLGVVKSVANETASSSLCGSPVIRCA